MEIGITHIRQVKVPVSDLPRSVAWYRRLLDLQLHREFVEDGVLRGAVLAHHQAGFLIGLRDRRAIPGQPSTAGHDLFSLGLTSLDALHQLIARCESLGIAHDNPHDRGPDGWQLDVPDPDGTVIRFLTPPAADSPTFGGVEFHHDGTMTFYDKPHLDSGSAAR